MTTNTNTVDACTSNSIILLAASGNSGTSTITAGQPITVHQVCFNLAENESINIIEDNILDLTTSIDLNGGGSVSEFPSYFTFQANHNTPCSVLVVNLTSFDVSKKEEQAYLNWTTSTETNNDYFSIEWSKNGRTFEEVGILRGAGNSNSEQVYNFTHTKPINGINYYRLKAIEYDGTFEYSAIKSLSFSTKESPITSFYPNPVGEQLVVNINDKIFNEPFVIQIRSITGQLLLEHHHQTIGKLINLSLGHLRPGSYLFIIENKQKNHVEHFVKM